MGHSGSKEENARLQAAMDRTSKMELKNLEEVFHELSYKNEEGIYVIQKPTWINQEAFAKKFRLPELVVEQLFQAFDKDQNGVLDVDEFLGGMVLCLHGSVTDKCHLLFRVFNLNGDDGINKEELRTMLLTALESAHVLLNRAAKKEGESDFSTPEALSSTVERIVEDAFAKCDTSRNGKLEIKEFERWIHKNSKLVKSVFMIRCPEPSKGATGHAATEVVTTPVGEEPLFDDEDLDAEKFQVEEPLANITMATGTSSSLSVGRSRGMLDDSSLDAVVSNTSTANNSPQPQQKSANEPLSSLFQPLMQPVKDIEGQAFFDSLGPMSLEETVSSDVISQASVDLGASTDDSMATSESMATGEEHPEVATHQEQSDVPDVPEDEPQSEQPTDSSPVDPLQSDRDNAAPLPVVFKDSLPMTISSPSMVQPEIASAEMNAIPLGDSLGFQTQPVLCESHSSSSPGKTLLQIAKREAPARPPQPLLRQDFNITMAQPAARRSYSTWNASPQTKHLIQQVQQGKAIDPGFLTSPSVLLEQRMTDPLKDLVVKFLGEQEVSRRIVPTLDTVTMNDAGLKDLLRARCWRSALDFTTKYLKAQGQGLAQTDYNAVKVTHTPKLMQMWQVRVALLFKLHMFSSAEAELTAFGNFDRADLYYEYYPDLYPGKKGCMVPFSLRVMHAELPQHNGRPNEALDRLYHLLASCRVVLSHLEKGLTEDGLPFDRSDDDKTETVSLWRSREKRISFSIANCFNGMKEYELAVKCYEGLIARHPEDEAALCSGLGRMLLQLGNVSAAELHFGRVETMNDETTSNDSYSLMTMNSGLLSIAKNQYEAALKHFQDVSNHDPKNIAAKNNSAVCLLFLGKVKAASAVLESTLPMSKPEDLHEDVIMNACTTYELETSKVLQQKQKLLDIVSRHKGDGFNVHCLKLT